MKKLKKLQGRKLVLHRESIAQLTLQQLVEVNGGSWRPNCTDERCPSNGYGTCDAPQD
jgi:hypothetical protein